MTLHEAIEEYTRWSGDRNPYSGIRRESWPASWHRVTLGTSSGLNDYIESDSGLFEYRINILDYCADDWELVTR
jgi:hypothetical protein